VKPADDLGIYRDGRHYDAENTGPMDDIPFYLKKIAEYGDPVLELACGTGRITIPIAERGFSVVGLDITESMLTHARHKAAKKKLDIELINADCRHFLLGRKFNVILFPFNSIGHLLDMESIEACFARVQEHLAGRGRFIFDFFNPNLSILTRDATKRYPVLEYPDPDGQGTVVITEDNVYDRAAQINRIMWYYKYPNQGKEIIEELNMRIFFPQELDALLKYNGLSIEAKYGDYEENPFTPESHKQVVVCTAGS